MKNSKEYSPEFRFWILMVSVSLIFILGFVYFVMITIYPLHNEMVKDRAIETLTHLKVTIPEMDSVTIQNYLETIAKESEDLSYILVMDTTGKTIAHSNPNRIGMSFYDDAFIKCLNQKSIVERIYYRDAENPNSPYHNEKTIDILDIYYDKSGKIAGEVNVGISFKKIEDTKKSYYTFSFIGTALWVLFMSGFAYYNVKMTVQRKKLNLEIRQGEEKYKTLLENTRDIPFTIDPQGNFQIIGPQILNYGLDPQQLIGENVLSVIYPDDRDRIAGIFKKSFLNKNSEGSSFRYEMPDGSIIWFEERANPLFDNSGKIIAFTGILRDITKQKKVENALIESEERFKLLFDSAPYSIILSDFEGSIYMVNKAFCKFMNLSYDEIIGHTLQYLGLIIKDDSIPQLIAKELLETGFSSRNEIELLNKEGKRIYIIYSSVVIILFNKKYILSSTTDITEKKLIEKELEKHRNQLEILVEERTEQLAQANEELEQINRELLSTNHELEVLNEELSKQREELEESLDNLHNTQVKLIQSEKMSLLGILASGIAHEINNPLNFIKGGYIGIERYFEENLNEHSHNVKPFFEAIDTGVERAAGIISSLTNYTGRSEKNNSKCNLNTIIDDCLVILANQLRFKIEVTKELTSDDYLLLGNESKLHQAVLNIILNAVQAIEGAGTISIKTSVKDNKIYLSVSDTGCGISEDVLPHILDPFYTTKEVGEGTGLGLSDTDTIIREHFGSLEIKSVVGDGTEVLIILPLSQG